MLCQFGIAAAGLEGPIIGGSKLVGQRIKSKRARELGYTAMRRVPSRVLGIRLGMTRSSHKVDSRGYGPSRKAVQQDGMSVQATRSNVTARHVRGPQNRGRFSSTRPSQEVEVRTSLLFLSRTGGLSGKLWQCASADNRNRPSLSIMSPRTTLTSTSPSST